MKQLTADQRVTDALPSSLFSFLPSSLFLLSHSAELLPVLCQLKPLSFLLTVETTSPCRIPTKISIQSNHLESEIIYRWLTRDSLLLLQVSSSCSSVYVDGSELRGSSNASVFVKYGTYQGLARFTVWMPEFPLEVSVADFRLSQIKGWKIPEEHNRWESSLSTS